jgi:hypothetical protein
MARAAKAAGLKHVIWSTLEDTRKLVPLSDNRMPTLMGKYKVPHFDAKGEINHVFTDLGLPVTFLVASFYWDNLYMFGMGPKKGDDGKYTITFRWAPSGCPALRPKISGKSPTASSRRVPSTSARPLVSRREHLTMADMAAKLSKGLGISCSYNEVTPDAYRSFGFPGAEDLGNMFQVYRDFENGSRRRAQSRCGAFVEPGPAKLRSVAGEE